MAKIQRARTERSKDQRREAILKAAGYLVDHSDFPALTMDNLAKHCHLAKGTLYNYFRTREEVLLSLLQQDFNIWFSGMSEYLKVTDLPFSSDFVDVWLQSLKSQPRLLRGLSYLHLMLEPNISDEFAFEWKTYLLTEAKAIHYQLLDRFQPHIDLALFVQFISTMTGLSIGMWMQSLAPPQIAKAYKRNPELKLFAVDFEKQFSQTAVTLLNSDVFGALSKLRRKSR